jgi:hypothetical protein
VGSFALKERGETMTSMKTVILCALLVASGSIGACSSSERRDGDAESDGGTDADGDVDTDADSDSDSDYEPDPWPSDTTPNTCAEAADPAKKSSIGCEFYAADLDQYGGNIPGECTDDHEGWNGDWMTYTLVVTNPQANLDAAIELWTMVDGEETMIYDETLSPNATTRINVTGECADCLLPDRAVSSQGYGEGRAFRLASDYPVLAYQWNPYDEPNEGEASLLFPTVMLGTEYISQSWRVGEECGFDEGEMNNGSQITVIATEDDTTITVTPKHDGIPGIAEMGETSDPISLNRYDVFTFAAATGEGVHEIPNNDPANAGDLSGTEIVADKPIAVFGGHVYGIVYPFNPDPYYSMTSGNHLEEQILPFATWGDQAVLARYAPRPNCDESRDQALWRIVAGADDMTITFSPPLPVPYGATHHFDMRGDVLEVPTQGSHFAQATFDNPATDDARAPFLAVQLMSTEPAAGAGGDGMMMLTTPTAQYLDKYVFVTNDVGDYQNDYVIVTKRPETEVWFECLGYVDQSEFSPVGGSGWEIGYLYVDNQFGGATGSCTDGRQRLVASDPVGAWVVGTAGGGSGQGAYGFPAGSGGMYTDIPIE